MAENNIFHSTRDLSKLKHSLKEKIRYAAVKGRFPEGSILRLEESISNVDPLRWLYLQEDNMRLYWSERDRDFEMAGVGSTEVIRSDAAESYEEVFAKMTSILNGNDDGLRFYGGFRFDKDGTPDPIWKDFGSYLFLMPALEIIREKRNTRLALNIKVDQRLNSFENLIEEAIDKIEDRLDFGFENDAKVKARVDVPAKQVWLQNVEKAMTKFREGELQKTVLARRSMFTFSGTIDAIHMMEQLKTLSPHAFHFYFQPVKGVAFIGATPELLYRRNNNKILSEAVAGTRQRGTDDVADKELANELLNSAKDIHEHDLVCRWIEQVLTHLCDSHETDEKVQILKSSRVQHLYRQFRGVLKVCEDAEILSMLHPTPAVAGIPREKSLQEIRVLEGFDRGWYAGPMGWIAADSAEFAVGIRSGVVDQNRLYLFSGAGVLPESDPEKEWQEIEQKINHFLKLFETDDN